LIIKICGDLCDLEPPLPIPNREVKRFSAYDTAVFCGTISHRHNFLLSKSQIGCQQGIYAAAEFDSGIFFLQMKDPSMPPSVMDGQTSREGNMPRRSLKELRGTKSEKPPFGRFFCVLKASRSFTKASIFIKF
jgi:hypothetical protein